MLNNTTMKTYDYILLIFLGVSVPPDGCTCIEGWNPNFGTSGTVCKDYDDSGFPWCYVADKSSCSTKILSGHPTQSGEKGWWAKCEAKGEKKSFYCIRRSLDTHIDLCKNLKL